MPRPTKIIIHPEALQHNLQVVRTHAPYSKILAMVKANGYGHGLFTVVDALAQADGFGVEDLAHGIRLRKHGVSKTIVLTEGVFQPEEYLQASQYDLSVVVHHHLQLQWLQQSDLPKPIEVWFKIDTGMHRLGFASEEVHELADSLQQNPNVKNPIVWMTHFADAAILDKQTTHDQITRFNDITSSVPGLKTLANSAGILGWPDAHADWVRPGIMLYGASPISGYDRSQWNLHAAMTLASQLVAIKFLKKGAAIGYGGRYLCPEDMPVGIIPVGYGDGYPRTAQDGTPVWINGHVVPLVGHVSMDRITVDLRRFPTAKIGDPVECWGEHLSPDSVATHAGTISYELFCRVTTRPFSLTS